MAPVFRLKQVTDRRYQDRLKTLRHRGPHLRQQVFGLGREMPFRGPGVPIRPLRIGIEDTVVPTVKT